MATESSKIDAAMMPPLVKCSDPGSDTRKTRGDARHHARFKHSEESTDKKNPKKSKCKMTPARDRHHQKIMQSVDSQRKPSPDLTTIENYASSVHRKRKIEESEIGNWYVIMFARNREDDDQQQQQHRTERTLIKHVSHVCRVLFPNGDSSISETWSRRKKLSRKDVVPSHMQRHCSKSLVDGGGRGGEKTQAMENTVIAGDQRSQMRWKVVLAIGPVRTESCATEISTLWSNCQRGIIQKAARGEALSMMYGIPGYMDWDVVFGNRDEFNLLYRMVVCEDPVSMKVIQKEEENAKDRCGDEPKV
jgi:hypothetical protein